MDKQCIGVLALALCLVPGIVAAAPMTVSPGIKNPVIMAEFVFDNNVRRTKDLPTSALRAARRKMISGEAISDVALQSLADNGDGLAAFRFGKILQAADKPDPTGVAAHYFAIAAYTGRAFAVAPLARLLKTEGTGYAKSRLRHCLNAMTVQALSGNPKAATLLGEMYADGEPFGLDLVQSQLFLNMAAGGDNPQGALRLGVSLMSDPADIAAGNVGALAALGIAAAGDDLAARVTAENLLRMLATAPPAEITGPVPTAPAPNSEVTQ